MSKPEDVSATLDLAIKMATEPNPQKNIFVQFWRRASEGANLNAKVLPSHLFPNIENIGAEQFKSTVLQAFARNSITRLAVGDCPQWVIGKHADASVSSLTLNANICFSIGNLTKISPSVLLREILSLVLHEAVHMGGAEESEAIAWQESFSHYFGDRFGDVTSDSVSAETIKSLDEMDALLIRARNLAQLSLEDPHIFALVGKILEKLASLPDFDDPLALDLKVQPKHTELIGYYSNSVLALIDFTQSRFESPLMLKLPIGKVSMDLLPPSEILSALDEIDQALSAIRVNFLAFKDDGFQVPVCVLPSKPVDVPGKPESVHNQQSYALPKVCLADSLMI